MKTRTSLTLLSCTFSALCLVSSPGWAETVMWQDNFDDGNGDNRWYADHGVWQIGSRTVGPPINAAGFRAHSSTTCATTGLNGNYLAAQDSRFIRIASFVVPAADQYPRLRFWHWFSFAGPYCPFNCDEGSYGYVEIKAGTNNWQQVSPTYNNSGSAVWSRHSIDLTAYAGQNVQVAFHFHSAHNTDVGWYVDDVAVVTGTPVFNNPEGFELGLGDWSAEQGTWEVGVPTSGPATNGLGWRAHGGTNCAATVLAGNYASSVDSRFVSPMFTVPASNSYPRLRFWHWFSFAGPYCPFNCDEGSYGYVEIKAGTNNWQGILSSTNTGQSGAWTQPFFDLSSYAGQTAQIAFHFHSAHNVAAGWYVDDVYVLNYTGGCIYSLNPTNASVGAAATNGTVDVTASTGCGWTATTNADWLRITGGASGSGNGAVNYGVDANPNTNSRTGTLTIAGYTFPVTQAGAPTNGVGWMDHFESYTVGVFPAPPWVNSGNTEAFVDNSRSVSGTNSLKLFGVLGGCWGALAHRLIGFQPPWLIEFYVWNGSETINGCHSAYGAAQLNTGPDWTSPGRGLIAFDVDDATGQRIIRGASNSDDQSDGVNLGTFNSGAWYKVAICYAVDADGEVRLSYWVNDEFRGTCERATFSYENDLAYLAVTVGEGSAWFDDVSIQVAPAWMYQPGPSLVDAADLGNGQFQFSFNTTSGVNYTIQYSSTLTNWIPLVTLGGYGGPLTIIDPNATRTGQRFYRVKLGP